MTATLIYDRQHELLTWAASRIECKKFRPEAKAIGIEADGAIRAVAVYEGFTEFDCDMHVAVDDSGKYLTRKILAAVFAYPFLQLNLRRISGRVAASNHRALKFDEQLGFEREGYHPHAAGDDDVVSLGMIRARCRFLPKHLTEAKG